MNDSRIEWKVGFFVFVSLVVSALLILNFSKGILEFQSTYKVHVIMPTAAGLKTAADVTLAGVPIGKVMTITLNPDERSVDIMLEILSKYKIRNNARFRIDEQGFIGDQYIEVNPAEGGLAANAGAPFLQDGASVKGEDPFNLQDAARSVSGLLGQAKEAMTGIDQAITNLNSTVLSEHTLTKFAMVLTNFEAVVESVSGMASELHGVLDSNAPPIHVALTNFVEVSRKLDDLSAQLGQAVSTTNIANVSEALKNLRDASATIKELAEGLQAGQGVAGGLLKDEQMKAEVQTFLTNANAMTEQFGLFGLHLNENGIWRSLWKPKASATNSPAR